jgi:Holliday junction resolvase-like predicted endonuclease
MSIEREILVAVLKLTKKGPIEYSLVGKDARVPAQTAETFLRKLASEGTVKWKGKVIEASPDQRVRIAVEALRLGADSERVCALLEWREFESIATEAFEVYEYRVVKNLRFKDVSGKRWEIDLLACRQPLILSVDCKHWQHKWTRAPIMAVAEQHVERTRAFAESLPRFYEKIGLNGWSKARVTPVILSLIPSPFKFHHQTPIVSVLQLQDFLSEMPAQADSLTCFQQKLVRIDRRITEDWQKPA